MRKTALILVLVGTSISLLLPIRAIAQSNLLNCQEARLTSPEPLVQDGFGWSVAVSGDRAIASAPQIGGFGPWCDFPACGGTTYVFRREGEAWVFEAKLLPPGGPNYFAARSVDISGDVIVVGAPTVNPVGEVYVFRRSNNQWSLSATLRASDGRPGNDFGRVVTVEGNLIVVGSGRVAYVFRYNGVSWVEDAKLMPPSSSSEFGISLAIDGERIVIGNWLDGEQCYRCGSAYVYRYRNGQWMYEATLVAPAPRDYYGFGQSVAISSDWIIAGAGGDDDACPCQSNCNTGAAFIFRRIGTDWGLEDKLTASDGGTNGGFGSSVSFEENLASLSGNLALVGSSHGAYIFQRGAGDWSQIARLTTSDDVTPFGAPVAIDHKYLIVGAPHADFAGGNSGAAYVFRILGLPDINKNGINDACEADCNGNGVPDDLDIPGGSFDCDSDGVPDECEPDCNANGQVDACDIAAKVSFDCTCDGVPDECEPDCNFNSFADSCDIAEGRSHDCALNGIPDECETDCNDNNISDSCDIASGQSLDCNHNQIPDSCDLLTGASLDCSGDGLPDECDRDCNENKIPDTCDVFSESSPDIDSDQVPDECEAWYHCVAAPGHFDFGPHRVDVQAEFLGQLISSELRVSDAIYERIVRDLAYLDSTYPLLTTVGRIGRGQDTLTVELDLGQPSDGFAALNDFYQGIAITPWPNFMPEWRAVTLCDTINVEVLRSQYMLLPEVTWVEHGATDGYNYNGDYIHLHVNGDWYEYEFSNGDGDCMSGCYCRQTWWFDIDSAGIVRQLGYTPGSCGCGDGEGLPNEGDFDDDGVMDCLDPCPAAEDDGPWDADGDSVGDFCDSCALTIPEVSVDAAGCPPDLLPDTDRDGDVAADDFARMRNCLGGPGQTQCGYPNIRVNLDTDWDIDLVDFAIFQNCFSGLNAPADASCMP